MRALSILILATLLVGCVETTEQSYETAAAEPAVEAADLARPDAANAAEAPEGEIPADWQWRFDRGSDYTVGSEADSVDTFFVTMTPGWHVTTRPAGIFWHPASTADGSFTVSSKIHLFDPGDRNEAYGVILGGSNLDGEDQEYLYFLLRRSGEYLVKLREGSETREVVSWTAHDAVVPFTDETEGTATNVLSVTVDGEQISFAVNDTEVTSIDKGELPTDGVVGFRFNHGINVHVESLDVTPAS